MAYGLSHGHVTDDVTWPWKVKLVTPIGNGIWTIKWSRDRWRHELRCYKAVRSAILATAWLLVLTYSGHWDEATVTSYSKLRHRTTISPRRRRRDARLSISPPLPPVLGRSVRLVWPAAVPRLPSVRRTQIPRQRTTFYDTCFALAWDRPNGTFNVNPLPQ